MKARAHMECLNSISSSLILDISIIFRRLWIQVRMRQASLCHNFKRYPIEGKYICQEANYHFYPITNKSKNKKNHTQNRTPIRSNKNAPKSQLKQNQPPPQTWFVLRIASASDRLVRLAVKRNLRFGFFTIPHSFLHRCNDSSDEFFDLTSPKFRSR